MEPPMRFRAAIASRIKVLAALDIAERRLPQDGNIKQRTEDGTEMNFRVSVLPTAFGESIVLRLLAAQTLQLDLNKLGMDTFAFRHFRQAIAEPSGMVLVTGPTGSGKTTTLYSALAALNSSERKIASAEARRRGRSRDPQEHGARPHVHLLRAALSTLERGRLAAHQA